GVRKDRRAEIIEKLNKEINAVLADSQMKARLAGLDAAALPGSPADFGKLIAEETEKWGKVVKFAGIKPQWAELAARYSINPVQRNEAFAAVHEFASQRR